MAFWVNFGPSFGHIWPSISNTRTYYIKLLFKVSNWVKKVLFGSLSPSIWFWHFLINFGPIWPNFQPYLALFMQWLDFLSTIHTQVLKLSGNVVLFGPVWSCRPLYMVLAFWASFGPIWPNFQSYLAIFMQYLDFF